jgi:hypothetical protein
MGIKGSRNDIRNVYKQYSTIYCILLQQCCRSGTKRYERKGRPWSARVRSKSYEYPLTQLVFHYWFQLDPHFVPYRVAHPIKDGPCPGKFHKIAREQNKKEGSDEPCVTADCELLPETTLVTKGKDHASIEC